MAEDLQYPHVFRNEDGVELIASNDVQGAAFANNGFTPAGKVAAPKVRTKTEE